MKDRPSVINQSTLTYLALLVLGICAAVASLEIPRDPDGSLGARVFPIMSSVTLVILGIVGFLSTFKEPVNEEIEKSPDKSFTKVTAVLVLSLFYVLIISKFGYLVATALISPLILLLFGIRNPVGLLVAAIVCPAVYHAIFFIGLNVYPPYGEWFDLLDLIQN